MTYSTHNHVTFLSIVLNIKIQHFFGHLFLILIPQTSNESTKFHSLFRWILLFQLVFFNRVSLHGTWYLRVLLKIDKIQQCIKEQKYDYNISLMSNIHTVKNMLTLLQWTILYYHRLYFCSICSNIWEYTICCILCDVQYIIIKIFLYLNVTIY